MSEQNGTTVGDWLSNVRAIGEPEAIEVRVKMDDGSEATREFTPAEIGTPAPETPEGEPEDEPEPEAGQVQCDSCARIFDGQQAFYGHLASCDGSIAGETPEPEDEPEPEPETLAAMPEDERDALLATLEASHESNPEAIKNALQERDLLQSGEDYVAAFGECPAEHHDAPIGRNAGEPFCAGCCKKSKGFRVAGFSDGQDDIFATLIEGGKTPAEAWQHARTLDA